MLMKSQLRGIVVSRKAVSRHLLFFTIFWALLTGSTPPDSHL
jgi:hypothetical protein